MLKRTWLGSLLFGLLSCATAGLAQAQGAAIAGDRRIDAPLRVQGDAEIEVQQGLARIARDRPPPELLGLAVVAAFGARHGEEMQHIGTLAETRMGRAQQWLGFGNAAELQHLHAELEIGIGLRGSGNGFDHAALVAAGP